MWMFLIRRVNSALPESDWEDAEEGAALQERLAGLGWAGGLCAPYSALNGFRGVKNGAIVLFALLHACLLFKVGPEDLS